MLWIHFLYILLLSLLLLLMLLLLMPFIWRKFEKMQHMCQVNYYRLLVASVMNNVFSHLRNTDSDMSNRSAAGRLFHTTGPLTAKLRSL